MKKYILLALFLPMCSLYAAVEVPTCSIDGDGNLTGSYNAIQQQAYSSSCEILFKSSTTSKVVPIGNNGGGTTSRIQLLPSPDSEGAINRIVMKLFGAEDNTLANGKRGRQEVASCYITEAEFNALPQEEQAFRRKSNDFYRGCAHSTEREVTYDFYLKLNDPSEENYAHWDSIIMQLHALNDKDLYCLPNDGVSADICNSNNGTIDAVARTVDSYNAKQNEGAVFEKNVQPPLSFRIKEGYFSIVATSGLTDAEGASSTFTPTKTCSLKVNSATVGKTKVCKETGKTTTVLYRNEIKNILPPNTYTAFRISVIWPSMEDNRKLLKIAYMNPSSGFWEVLADTSKTSVPFGTYDSAYPYFKAGVYRQGGNSIPTTVELLYFKKRPYQG